jgi:hypothetical protein
MLLSQGIGMAFSLAQGEREIEKNVFSSVYFRVGLVFHLVVAVGVAFLCYRMEPDWMLMYLSSKKHLPKAMVAYIFSGYVAMYVLGFLAVPQMRKYGRRAPWVAFGSLITLIFGFIGITFDRLWHVGDLEEYEAGTARSITETALFPVLAAAMPSAVGGLGATLLALRSRVKEPAPGGS